MNLKCDAKFEEKLICCFKNDKNLVIWPEHSKVSRNCTLTGSYCAKYLMFDLKKHRGVIFHDTEEWLGKSHEEFGRFSPEHWELSKLGLSWDLLSKIKIVWA